MIYFILGSHPKLSIQEIYSVIENPPKEWINTDSQILLLDDVKNNLGELQNRLAGTIKIGNIIGELKQDEIKDVTELIASFASEAIGKNKISFGLSVYDNGNKELGKRIEKSLKELGKEIKKALKETGRPVRYVSSKEPKLSSVIVKQNGLLESGGEFVFIACKNKILIGQTETVQDFKAWSKRDFGRPARDAKSGMLPPKLARMMINLASSNHETIGPLLDPFCGSGTILMEAMLLGFTKVIGSDISEKAIDDTRKNLQWLKETYDPLMGRPSHKWDQDLELFVSSAEALSESIQEPVDLIVTETFLGTPRSSAIRKSKIEKVTKDLLSMYRPSFVELHKLLKKDGMAVVAFPAFVLSDGSVERLPLKSMLEKIGFNFIGSYLYKRDKQYIAREIVVLSL